MTITSCASCAARGKKKCTCSTRVNFCYNCSGTIEFGYCVFCNIQVSN